MQYVVAGQCWKCGISVVQRRRYSHERWAVIVKRQTGKSRSHRSVVGKAYYS